MSRLRFRENEKQKVLQLPIYLFSHEKQGLVNPQLFPFFLSTLFTSKFYFYGAKYLSLLPGYGGFYYCPRANISWYCPPIQLI